MTITTEHTRAMHEFYNTQVAIEDIEEEFTMSQNFRWEAWLFRKFTKDDLALVIRYMRYRIRMGKREKESLLLRNLISNPDEFSENLSMARSWSRSKRTAYETDKQRVLKSSGMDVADKLDDTHSAKSILERPRLAQMLKEWREREL